MASILLGVEAIFAYSFSHAVIWMRVEVTGVIDVIDAPCRNLKRNSFDDGVSILVQFAENV